MKKHLSLLMLVAALIVPWASRAQDCTQTVPYTQDFESFTGTTYSASTGLEMPSCWNGFSSSTSTSNIYMPRVVSGTGSYVYYHGQKGFAMTGGTATSYGMNKYVLLPPMNVPLNQLQLTFWMCTESNIASYGTLHVGYVTSDDTSTFVSIANYPSSAATYHSGNGPQASGVGLDVELILSQIPATATRLAFKWEHSNSSYHTCCIDDIVVGYPPSCPRVDSLFVTPSSDEVLVSWAEMGSATEWEVVVSNTTGVVSTNVVSTNPATITNLIPNTNYTVSVRAVCSIADTSIVRSTDFRTLCSAVEADSLPWTYGFEDASGTGVSASFNPCMRKLTNYTTAYPYPSSTYKHGGTYSLYFYSTSAYYSCVSLPMMEEDIENLYLTFWAYKTSANYGHVYVGVMSNPGDISTFDTIATLQVSAVSAWEFFEVPLSSYTGNGGVIALLSPNMSAASYVYIDDITVTYPPACPTPSGLIASNATANSVDLSWTSNASEFIVEYGRQGFTQGTGDSMIVNANAVTLTGLSMGVSYGVYVTAVCGDDTSNSLYGTVTSGCSTITDADLPYIEDFESYGSGSAYPINACWAKGVVAITGSGTTTNYPYPSATAINGTRSLYFYTMTSTSNSYYNWMVLPPIDETMSMSDLMVTFKMKRSTTSSYKSRLVVGVTTDYTSTAGFVPVDTIDLTSLATGTVQNVEVSFADYTDTGRYVLFYAPAPTISGSTTVYNNFYVDDIALRAIPTCYWPASVALESISSDEATISWTPDPRTPSPSGWNIEYGPAGFTPGNGTMETASDTTITLTNLSPSTQYDIYLSADCGSELSDPAFFSFRTACVGIDSLPYTEDFESYGSGTTAFPECWYKLGSTADRPYINATTSYGHNNTHGLYFYAAAGGYCYGVMPPVDTNTLDLGTLQVSFWARQYGTSYNCDFVVGVMTDPTNVSTFTAIGSVHPEGLTYEHFEVPLASYTGTGTYIALSAIQHPGTSTAIYLMLDDVTLEPMPACPSVTNLEASASVGAAVLTWDYTSGYDAPSGYVVVYDSVGGTSPVTLNVSDNSASLSGLTAGTSYMAYVYADCGSDGYGHMDSVLFSTENFRCLQIDSAGIDTIAIGTGTTASSGVLVYSSYGNTIYQTIYKASELTAAGLTAGPVVAADFGFDANSSYAKEFTIFMANSTKTSFSSSTDMVDPSTMTQVYGPTAYPTHSTAGWRHFEFAEFFEWDGVSNIVVCTFMNQPSGTSQSTSSFSGYSTSTSYTGISAYRYKDSSPYTVDTYTSGSSGSTSTNRASVKFYSADCLVLASCAAPSVAISDVDSASVTLTWSAGYDETAWDVDYRVSGATTWINVASATSSTTYTVTGLTPATDYEFRVGFACSDGYDYYSYVSAFTPCVPVALPYTENFDALTTGTATTNLTVMPNCWDFELTGTSTYQAPSYYPGVYYSTSYSNSGNYCLRLYGQGYFMLPEMSASLDSLMISFNGYITAAAYSNLVVGAMENGVFVPIDTATLAVSNHTYVEMLLSNYHGNSRTIAFYNPNTTSTTYYSYVYIDDLRVEYVPTCMRPITVNLTSRTDTEASFAWDSLADGYEVYVSTTPVNPDTVAGATFTTTYTNSVTITGLTQNTQYYFYVRTNCGLVGYSDWSNELVFRTSCAEQALPYTENFEAYGTGAANPISNCWTKGTNSTTAYPYPYATNAVTGSRSLYFYAYHPSSATATPYYSYAALPMFQDSTNRLMLSFNVRRYATVSNLYTTRLVIGVMTNPDDINTFFPMDTLELHDAAGSSIHGYEYCFNNYTGSGRYIAIYDEVPPLYGSTYSYSYAYVDDIVVDTIPNCMRPQSITVTGITQTSANVHWIAGENASSFEIEYGPAGFVQGMGTMVTSYDDSVALVGLNPSTTYDVYVRAICSANEQSNWSFAQSFSTICGPTALPMSFDPDNYATGTSTPLPNCWTRTNNSTGSYNYYPYIYGSATNAHTGTNVLYYYFSTSSGYSTDEIMAFPEIDVTNYPMNTVEVSFWAKASTTGKHYIVGVMTDPTDMTTFQTVDTIALTTTSTEYTVEFSNYTGTGAYVALRGVMEGTATYYIYVDDINIGVMAHCPRAYDLTAYDGTATGATLEWTDTIGSTQWVVKYGQYGDTATTTVTVNTNPYTLTGLTANTIYYYTVAPICSDNVQSDWSHETYYFSTSQVPATIPYSYDFETGTEWANWQTLSNNTVTWSRGNAAGNPGYSMYLSNTNGTTRSWDMASITNAAVYRDFDFGATPVSVELTYDFLMGGSTDGNYDGVTIMVVDPAIVPEVSSTGLTSPWGSITTVNARMDTVWSGENYYLDGMQGVKRLVFFHFNQATASTHPYIDSPDAIDNIAIGEQPCARPYDLTVSNITDHSAFLSWAGPATDTYVVAHRIYGASAATNVFDTVSGNSLLLSGLISDTEYVYWVTHVCSVTATDTNVSVWSNGYRFATECTIHPLPYLETFDSVAGSAYNADGILPDCWRAYSNGTNSAYMPHVVGSGSYFYNVSGNALTMTSGSETYGSTKIVALPPFDVPVSACGIRFWYRHESINYGTLEIGYVTGPDLAETFHALVALPACTTMTHIDSTMLSGAPANATRIALRWTHNASFYSVGIDDIEVWAGVLCPTPSVTLSNLDYESVTLTAAGNGSLFELDYGTDPAVYGTTMTSTDGMFNITGLTPATQYFYRVRQQCDSTNFSLYNEGFFVTDSLPCVAVSDLTLVGTTFNSVSVSWTANGEETAWEVNVFSTIDDTTVTATTTAATVGGLVSERLYNISVRPMCGSNHNIEGPWSDTIQATTDQCQPVTNLTVSNIGATMATIGWTAPENASNFRVIYGLPNFDQGGELASYDTESNPFELTNLEPNSDYTVRVANVCAENLVSQWTSADFSTTGVGINGVEFDGSLSLYPNPASTTVTLSVSEQMVGSTVSIVDVNGRVVMSEVLNAQTLTMNLSDLAKGAYFVRITGEETTVVRKLIVE